MINRVGLPLLFTLACGADPLQVDEVGPDEVTLPSATVSSSAGSLVQIPTAAAPPDLPDPEGSQRFEAVVRVSKAKRDAQHKLVFTGVWLVREGEPQDTIASYASSAVWEAMDGKKVRVLGVPYHPMGRSLAGQHMQVLEARLVNPSEATSVIGFGRAQELEGQFQRVTVGEGQKASGDSFWAFDQTRGASYEVFDGFAELAEKPELAQPMKIRAHVVELSPTIQRRGGPFLWVREAPLQPKRAREDGP